MSVISPPNEMSSEADVDVVGQDMELVDEPGGDDLLPPPKPPVEADGSPDNFEKIVTASVVGLCCAFVFWQLQPSLIFSDTTPTGGDMGAHVWGPAFLRDELLPRFRLSGWTPDWYGGFPAFHFYMVIPALAIVALDVGLQPVAAAIVLVGFFGGAVILREKGRTSLARYAAIGGFVLAPLVISMPYNIAFKLIAVSGVVLFPLGAWALGHLSGLRFPGPAVLSLSSLAFAFDRSFNILGGNIASTLAGEFANSISLTLSLIALGFVMRGTRTGQYRAWAGVFIALTGLSHLLPAFFLLAAVFVVMIFRLVQGHFRSVPWIIVAGGLSALLSAFWVLPFFLRTSFLNDMGWERIEIIHSPLVTRSILNPADTLSDFPPLPVLLTLAAVGLVLSIVRRIELGGVLFFVAAIMAFAFVYFPDGRLWNARILPFYYLSVTLLAGIGVGQLIRELVKTAPIMRAAIAVSSVIVLLPSSIRSSVVWPEPTDVLTYLSQAGGYALRVLAITMLVASIGTSVSSGLSRIVPAPLVAASLAGIAVLLITPARDIFSGTLEGGTLVWWGLAFLFAVIAIGATVAWPFSRSTPSEDRQTESADDTGDAAEAVATGISSWFGHSNATATHAGAAIVAAASVFVVLGLSLQSIGGINQEEGEFAWGAFGQEIVASQDQSFINGWAAWNFSGLQGKEPTPDAQGNVGQGGWDEYNFVQRTMQGVGEQNGCGRAMWEFAPELNRYGTTMAMMLLPLWTDGCISSQEGLFFEATPSVPYHFLLQSDLSAPATQIGTGGSFGGPSRAMRNLPYQDFDIDRGVERLQELGVRYYMAFSPEAVNAARLHPELREVANAQPWVVFETQSSALVEPLNVSPVVIDGVRDHQDEWLDVGVEWFTADSAVRPASSGPADWPRVDREIVERYEAPDTRLAGSIGEGDATLASLLPEVDIAEQVTVSGVETDTDVIRFSVDQIGTPVLVRSSFFPNWKAEGAEGPFRVAPNFMVVVPTDTDVELRFARNATDWTAIALTLAGAILLVAIGRNRLPSFLDGERTQVA